MKTNEYSLTFESKAYRIFKKFQVELKEEFVKRAEMLKTNPIQGELLQGKLHKFRSLHFNFRGTAYRIIYEVHSDTKLIIIRLADKRENIYKRLERQGI